MYIHFSLLLQEESWGRVGVSLFLLFLQLYNGDHLLHHLKHLSPCNLIHINSLGKHKNCLPWSSHYRSSRILCHKKILWFSELFISVYMPNRLANVIYYFTNFPPLFFFFLLVFPLLLLFLSVLYPSYWNLFYLLRSTKQKRFVRYSPGVNPHVVLQNSRRQSPLHLLFLSCQRFCWEFWVTVTTRQVPSEPVRTFPAKMFKAVMSVPGRWCITGEESPFLSA